MGDLAIKKPGRLRLEARRAIGWLAFVWVVYLWRGDPMRFPRTLSWAGRFAHWDSDRANWRDDADDND